MMDHTMIECQHRDRRITAGLYTAEVGSLAKMTRVVCTGAAASLA